MSTDDPSLVDSATLQMSAAGDVERAYRLLHQARVTMAELDRRRRCRAAPVVDLKAWRKARGLTVNKAAEMIGIGRSSWLKYEADPALTPRYALLACAAIDSRWAALLSAAPAGRESAACFECGHELNGPYCPACNPAMVPDGWVLVPRELTEAMQRACWRQQYLFNGGSPEEAATLAERKVQDQEQAENDREGYRALLSAAPSPPTLGEARPDPEAGGGR